MPQQDANRNASRRGVRKSKRKPVPMPKPRRAPSATGRARAQEQQYGSQGRSVERQANRQRREARERKKPTGPFGMGTAPFARQQRQASKKTRRAQDQLPRTSRLPHVPDVRDSQGRRVIPASEARRIYEVVQREAGRAGGLRKLYDASPAKDRALLRLFGMVRDHKSSVASAGRPRSVARPKPEPKRVGIPLIPATINATALGDVAQDVGRSLAAGHGSGISKFLPTVGGRIVDDAKTLGTAPFVAGYELGASAWESAHGDTGRAERLAADTWEGLKQSVPGRLVQGDFAGAAEEFAQHPLLGLLDVGGVGALAGRTTGAVLRGAGSKPSAGGVRGAMARGGSTVRPPLAIVDDAGAARAGRGIVERRYSKDSTRKATQVAADRSREPLKDAEGNTVTVTQRGREVPVLRASTAERERHARKAADFDNSRANSVERLVRDTAAQEMKVRGIRGKRGRDLVSMVVEGTVTSAKHFEDDLRGHAATIRAALDEHEQMVAAGTPARSPFRHKGEVKAAETRLRMVEEALGSKRVLGNASKIVEAGEAIGRKLNEVEQEALRMGLLTGSRAERARRVVAAIEHMGARHFTPEELAQVGLVPDRPGQMSLLPDEVMLTELEAKHGGIRREDGTFLSNREIDAFLKERGRDPESIAYLPHRLDVRGRRAFHTQFRPGQRGTMEKSESRTGHAYERGVTESSARLIQEQGVRQATQLSKARQLDRMIEDRGMTRPDGKLWTAQEALEFAQRAFEDSGGETRLVPVRAFAAKLDEGTRRIIREDLQGPSGMETLGLRLLNDRVVHQADVKGKPRARNVVLVDQAYLDQLQRHLRPAGAVQKMFQMVNRPFRFAVLAQPRWLVGNFVEPFLIRLPVSGGGLVNVFGMGMDIAAASKTLRAMDRSSDPKVRAAAVEIRAQHLGGLFIGGRGASVRRSVDEMPMFNEAYGRMVARMPAVAQGVDLVRSIGAALMAPGNVYFRVNRAIENVAQRAAIGKELRRDVHEWSGSWLKTVRLQADALDEAMRGLTGTPTQRRFMREQHKLLGKYEGFPPWLREIVQGPMPFLPWALNAARFVYWTMPAEHTALTALLVQVNDVVAKDWEELRKDVPPGGLKLAIPTKKGGWIDLARYTPYGLTGPAAHGELEGLNQVAPQFQSPFYALFLGLDPFGRRLQMEDGQEADVGDRVKVALNSLLEAGAPYVGQTRRILEGGGTGYSDSTVVDRRVKPGTDYMSGPRRTFDPFRPTYLQPPTSGEGAVAPARPRSTGDTLDDRISRALERLDDDALLDDDQDERINRALEQLGG